MSSAAQQKTKVFLIDDHPLVREGISMLLTQAGFIISGEADNCDDALEGIIRNSPDLLILDISLRHSTGFDLLEKLSQKGKQTPALVYSMHEDPATIEKALMAGASGYVTKRELPRTIVSAIDDILSGKIFLGQTAAASMIRRVSGEHKDKAPIELLSQRERDIYSLLGEGFRTSEIAQKLHMSISTVESYYQRMKIKLSVKSTGDLRRQAIREGKQRKAPWKEPE